MRKFGDPIAHRWTVSIAAIALATLALGCASSTSERAEVVTANDQPAAAPAAVPEIRPGLLRGYLSQDAIPKSAELVPPPPEAGSEAFKLDEEVAKSSLALRDSPRWVQATVDAYLKFPEAAGIFSCALGAPVNESETPHLYQLLRRTLTDAALSTYGAKNKYMRPRPFMVNQAPLCTPDDKAALEKDGSYPSGHSAIGWTWALVLAKISPDQEEAILARGRSFGESRNVCNVHWRSDVVEGRSMGEKTVAALEADPTFRADFQAAKEELAAVRGKRLPPIRSCADEAAALKP